MLSKSCCLFGSREKKQQKPVEAKDILVVIDFQPLFFSAARNKEVLNVICHELQEAMKNNHDIVFLRLFFCGSVHAHLQKIVEGYDKVIHTFKWADNDGSMSLLKAIQGKHISPRSIRVCGINTDLCVLATVQGLRNKISDYITIISDGCDSFTPEQHVRGLQLLNRIPNVGIERLDLLTPHQFKEVTNEFKNAGLFADSKPTEQEKIASTILGYLENYRSIGLKAN